MYDIKYDRQIRLFGKDVQSKLSNLSVSVLSEKSDNFVSGEILKNLVLLGVNKIYADENTLISFNKLVPNQIKEINPKVNILNKPEGIFFVIGNFKNLKIDKAFYISSDTFEFSTTSKENTTCKENTTTKNTTTKNTTCRENFLVKDCLLGALVVQEFIKMIQNQEYQKYFSINLTF